MNNTTNEPIKRPLFLTILCFLTFMSSFSGLWQYGEQIWSPGRAAAQTKAAMGRLVESFEMYAEDKPGGDEAIAMQTSIMNDMTPDRLHRSAIVMFIYNSLTLFGAFYMFQLSRRGYIFYLGAIAAGIIGTFLYIGGVSGLVLTFGNLLMSGVMALLYRLNLKFMS